MADFSALIAQFAGQAAPSTGVASPAPTNNGLPSDEQLYQAAVGRANGTGFATLTDPIRHDLLTLNDLELLAKYGPDAGRLISAFAGAQGRYSADRTAVRGQAQTVGDVATSAGLGGASTLLSIPAFAAGMVSPQAGVWGAEKIKELNDWGQSHESAGLQVHRRAYEALDQLHTGENTAQFEKDKQSQGAFVASLSRIGRDALSSAKDAISDPTILSDGIANGAGSLLAVSPLAKGIGMVAKAALPAEGAVSRLIASAAESNPALKSAVDYTTEHGPTLAAIGAMEGGGAYQQTVADARAKGASVEDANKAGLIAGAIQTPAAMVTGPIVAKFEENPLAARPLGEALTNVVKEGVEEGIQSGSGQLAQNVGEKATIDPNQSLSEGVGGQAALGAVYSMGSAGAVEAPGVLAHGPMAAGKAAVNAVKGLAAKGDQIIQGINAEQAQSATDAQNQAVASAPELNQELQAATAHNPELQGKIDNLFSSVAFDPTETQNEAPVVQQAVQGATDRYQALRQVAQATLDPKLSDAERAQAGAYLVKSYGEHQDTLINGFNQALDGEDIPDNHPAMGKLQGFIQTVSELAQHPVIKAAVEKAQEAVSKPSVSEQFSKEALSTPEGVQNAQHTAEAVVSLAAQNPEKADPSVLDTIRAHAVQGTIQLTAEQMKTLLAAHSLVRATQDRLEAQKHLGLSSADQVTNEIQTQDSVEDPEKTPVRSAAAHAKGVMDAVRAGDLEMARTRLQDLSLFAQHMQNKVEALNTNYASGRPDVNTGFKALSPTRKLGQAAWYDAKPVFLNPKSERSVQSAQQTALDAKAVAQLANGVATAFPELGVKHVTPVSLGIDPNLERKAADIAQEHQQGQKTSAEAQVNADKPQVDGKEKANSPKDEASQAATEDQSNSTEKPAESLTPGPTNTEPSKAEPVQEEQSKASPAEGGSSEVGGDKATASTADGESHARLLGSKDGKNGFVKAFRQPVEARSRLAGLGDRVAKTVIDAFASAKAFMDHLGVEKLDHKLTPEILDTYSRFLGAVVPEIQTALEKRLEAFLAKNDISKAKAENPAQNWIRGRVLNLVEDHEGKLSYHPELLQSSILAGIQWLLTTGSRPSRILGEDEVADLLGISPTEVSDEQLDLFNQGVPVAQVKRDLAETITRFWGVTPDPKAPMGFTKGIPEAMAAEVLKAMQEAGLLQFRTEKFGQGDGTRTFNWIDVADDEALKNGLAEMAAFPGAIEQLALTEPQEIRFIGAPPKSVAEFQMRNQLVRNTEQQKQAIRAEQDTPHFLNPHMVSFLEGLGPALVLRLFGAGDLESQKLNRNHALSLKGQNATVGGAYDALMAMVSEVRNKAEAADTDPHEMPIHYEYNVSRVGRLHMLGLHNPQSSKLMREAILPTRVTLDLTKSDNFNKFMLAVAQAWGIKVHKQSREASVNAALNLASGRLSSVLPILGGALSGSADLGSLVEDLKTAFGDDLSPAAVHAAMELARFNQASEAEKRAFQTHLYVEADGVTDGPINALVHISTGAFSPRWVQLVAKGGLFLGSKGMTVNRFVNQGPEQGRDLYQATTDAFRTIMGQFRQKIAGDKDLAYQSHALMTLMDRLLPDLSFDGDTLEIARGIAKNPLTVTIYGSGAMGIADKVTGAVVGAFYEELSKAAQGLPNHADELKEMIDHLGNTSVFSGKNGLFVSDVSQKTAQVKDASNEAYTLTPDMLANLRQNVLHLFVSPLRDAIEATIQDTQAGRTRLREAVQIQSIFLQHAFRQMVEQKLAEKPEEERKLFLSQAELNEIYKQLKGMSPLIETGTQSFFVGGSEKSDVQASEFARSLDDQLSTPAYVYGPTDAGVAGIPYLVIGPGDGQMMQNLATMKDAPQGTLKVFDGVHLKLDTLDEDAGKVNQAVYQAWQNSPLSAVNESFQKFLEGASFADMPEAQLEALKRALFSKQEQETATAADVEAQVRFIGRDLDRLSQEAQARHEALAKVEMSVDHMASAEQPYQASGESLEGMDEAKIADRLNELMTEPKAEVEAEAVGDAHDRGRAPVPAEVTSAQVIPAHGLPRLVNGLKIPAEQKNLLKEIVRSLQKRGWQIVRGTADQTAAHALEHGETPYRGGPGQEIKGYTNLGTQKIYLHTDSPETLLHELLHASVTQKILDHYRGDTSADVSEAISHLETLMSQWMVHEEDLSGLSPEQRQAFKDALAQVKAELNNADRLEAENKAAALDEYLAWNLSNQDLIRLAQKTRVENPLARVVKRVLIALKNLIWGRKMAPMVRSDMYSALRFNASVLINSGPTLQSRAFGLTRAQSVDYGQSDRLAELHTSLMNKVGALVKQSPDPAALDKFNAIQATIADKVAESFMAHGFPMTMQEHSAFTALVTILATQARLDQAALARVQDLYAHVTKQLTVEDFLSDPAKADPSERYYAQQKFDAVMGNYLTEYDDLGRSTLLPSFLALAMVNDDFRSVLSKMELPKGEWLPNDHIDNVLTNFGMGAMDQLAKTLSGEGRGRANVQEALDVLTERLAANAEDQGNFLSQLLDPVGQAINWGNETLAKGLAKGSEAAVDQLTRLQEKTENRLAKGVLEVGKLAASIANEEQSKAVAEGVLSMINQAKLWKPLHELISELIGEVESNASIQDLVKQARSVVQQMRQQFREHLPDIIAKQFSEPLSKEQWTHLFHGLGKTDLASLHEGHSIPEVLEMLTKPAKARAQIRSLEADIRQEAGDRNFALIEQKAKQLAHFMMTGEPGHHLLRNAEAVAKLFGVKGKQGYEPSKGMISSLDRLISLYALQELSGETQDTLSSLAQKEPGGMEFVLSYLVGQRADEQAKLVTDKARVNHYKGFIPSEAQKGANLIVADDGEKARLLTLGYRRVGDYKGSFADHVVTREGAKGYYFSPVSGRSPFSQGVMQNVRQTASGVDPVTGHTHGGPQIAGRVTDPLSVKRLAGMNLGSEEAEPLMPVFDAEGQIVAFERSMDPNQELKLSRNTNLAHMIGAWRGRQAEESLAGEFNKRLVKVLADAWSKDKAGGRQDEYVNLFDDGYLKTDPVMADAVKLFTPETLALVKAAFGTDGFRVRKDMINDAIGYRSASVGDAWTGNTRLNPAAIDVAKKAAIGVFGVDAYRYLVTAEKYVQGFVAEAKQTIVVRSVIVPVSNMIANVYQMSSRGIGLARIAKGMPQKLSEVNAYAQRKVREIEAEAELRAAQARDDVVASRKLSAELQSIQDANRRMTIWPLIEAGEFSAISEAGLLERDDLNLYDGDLHGYIERLVDKLPPGVRSAARYWMVARDTPLFQGMQKAMEYGDFLAKAITYDHLTQEKKLGSEEAIRKVREEYVNYDRLRGRTRAYLESMGLMWFSNYKIRITKIAVSTLRNNPLHALLTSLVPAPPLVGNVGLPLSDNFFSVLANGKLGYSLGPHMGLNADKLNPWANLFGVPVI